MLEGLKNYDIYDGQQSEEQTAQSAANKIDNNAAESVTGWTDWKKLLFLTGAHQNYQANMLGRKRPHTVLYIDFKAITGTHLHGTAQRIGGAKAIVISMHCVVAKPSTDTLRRLIAHGTKY